MKKVSERYMIVLLIVSLFSIKQVFAFNNPPVSYLGIEQGLSNNAVRCIYQDHKGFMWFGTYDGLNRYDGYDFKVFRNKFNDSTSLVNNWIYAINEDRNNNLWVGTRQGVSIYNNLSGKFLPVYYVPSEKQPKQKITAVIKDIEIDNDGNVLIGTQGHGLMFCTKGSTTAIRIPFESLADLDYDVQSIEISEDNKVWVFIQNRGLCIYDFSSHKIKQVNATVKSAFCLESDSENIWMGTGNGIYRYNTITNSCHKMFGKSDLRLTSDVVVGITMDQNKNLWIATNGGGINIFKKATGTMEYMQAGNDKNSLTSDATYTVYEDKESRKWIGTIKGGINIIDPQKDRFKTIVHNPFNPKSLSSNFIYSFYEAPDSMLWIGTDGDGLSIWNRKNNVFDNYRHDPHQASSLSDNSITCIAADDQSNIWLGTFFAGMNRYNKTVKKFERFKCINPTNGIENKVVFSICQDHDHNLWVGTLREAGANGALYIFNQQQNRFDAFDTNLSDLFTINEDRNGQLWGGNLTQLIRIDKKNKLHRFYDMGKPVRSVQEDIYGNFWVGTEGGGLILFDRKQEKIVARYTTEEGLCNNSVLTILYDGKNNLWISTFNGIAKFNVKDRTVKNYYQNDGLQSNQFNYNAALALRSGQFVFGGIKGFSIFYPDKIDPVKSTPDICLTGLRINDVPIEADNSYVIKKTNEEIQTIRVPYNKAVFSFDFTTLEYSSPNKISYAYYLEGGDRDWNYSKNIRTANYTNLKEGNYTFRVKSTNAEGIWNVKELAIKIIVLPPWFRSWWAYILYLLATGAVIYFYLWYKSKQTRLKYEIKITHLNAEKEKEMNEKKLSFFTNISHEFRTPLTLIINPVKDILAKNNSDETANDKELNTVYRNARRLLSLVDQLLLFRKADSGMDKIKPIKLNFYDLCKEVYLCFVQQARSKKIAYDFECENEELEICVDREKMEIILYNLISNALKYTPSGGKVLFKINETAADVEVLIQDNGYGIPKEAGEKLFEKFYQAERKDSISKPGFGIGLYLVKHFTEEHKGDISYQSEVGKGTTFTLKLKKGTKHFKENIIFGATKEEHALLDELAGDEIDTTENQVKQGNYDPLASIVTEKKSILIVDDDAQIRQYVAGIFSDNFSLYEASNGEYGIKLAQKYLPDIIICDVKMHGIGGIELCRFIKKDSSLSHIPVILLTGSSSAQTRLEGVEGGADDYITKPFEKEMLVARVTNLLKTRNDLQKYFYNEITLNKNSLKISEEYKDFLEKCISIVETHLEDDDFTVKKLVAEIGMSHSNLFRKVKSVSGQSINVFIRFIRLRKAAEFFINTDYNVNETAFQVGIKDIKYFREQFNKVFGINPSDYIKKYRKPFANKYTIKKESFDN